MNKKTQKKIAKLKKQAAKLSKQLTKADKKLAKATRKHQVTLLSINKRKDKIQKKLTRLEDNAIAELGKSAAAKLVKRLQPSTRKAIKSVIQKQKKSASKKAA